MTNYFHLMNMRTPIDNVSQEMLSILGKDYILSFPIEADPPPGNDFIPVSQGVMIGKGIVGVYVTLEAVSNPEMLRHMPFEGLQFNERQRIKIC